MKLLLLVAVLGAASSTAFAERLLCYYSNWSRYGKDAFQIENIEPSLCTHFVYAFFGLDETGLIKSVDPWNDLGDEWTEGGLARFLRLKKQNPSAKLLIGVGGWNQGATNFQVVVRSPEKRKMFLDSALGHIQRYKFDGLEIDWIYQDSWGGTPADKAGLSELVKEMNAAFQQKNYILGLSTSANPTVTDNSYDIPALIKNLHFLNVLTYDLHGSWDGKTGHVAPLHALKTESPEERKNNVEAIIARYMEKGAVPEKLNLAIVSYGRTYTLQHPDVNGPGAPARGPGREEPLPYKTFCVQDNNKLWKKSWIDEQKVPYAVNGDQWVGHEDVRSLREKVKFARSKKLGGVSFWSLEMDDFRGNCGTGKFPLLNAVKDELSKK